MSITADQVKPGEAMKTITAIFAVMLSLQVHGADWEESREIRALFEDAGVDGTFVLYDVAADRYVGHNRVRAETRFVPASTFKIANTLIGLSVGAVESVDEVLPYGGQPQAFKSWARDMSLREAIAMSNVTIYQELARRIGLERMQAGVARIDYGNADIGSVVDNFWLVGPLEISAKEQTRFLADLARQDLPSPRAIQNSVGEIILVDEGEGWTLFGKTGWENAPEPGTGWWVGWVHRDSKVYPFALNIDVRQASDAGKRVELGRACLTSLGLL